MKKTIYLLSTLLFCLDIAVEAFPRGSFKVSEPARVGNPEPIYQSFPGDPLEIPRRGDIPGWSNDQWWGIFTDIKVGNLGQYCPVMSNFENWDRLFVIRVGYYYYHPDLQNLPRGLDRLMVAEKMAKKYGKTFR